MQYLLTEQEYKSLLENNQQRKRENEESLQRLCTLAAMHIPIVMEWSHDKTPRPWGCILGPEEQDPGYCDDCPAQEVCPHDGKAWSQ